MPTLKEVTLDSMNYASVVFFGTVVIAAVWYGIWGYNNYRGPPTDAVDNHSMTDSNPDPTEEITKTKSP
jgi:hypothetical protein